MVFGGLLRKRVRTVIYTVSHINSKTALDNGHMLVDLRTKFGNKLYAMPAALAMAVKDQANSQEWLMDAYKRFLETSIAQNPAGWKQFIGLKSVAICDDRPVDHAGAARMVFRTVLMNYLLDQGQRPILGGEIFRNEHRHYGSLIALHENDFPIPT